MTETIGWVASGLVVLSLITTSIVRLRVIGLVASFTFIVYSVLIEAWPHRHHQCGGGVHPPVAPAGPARGGGVVRRAARAADLRLPRLLL